MQYLGTGGTIDRLFTMNCTATAQGVTLDASGSGAISYTNTGSIPYGTTAARTLTLTGTNTGNNTLAATLADNGTGALSVTKNGLGTWSLTNTSNSFTGSVTINGGTLGVAAAGSGSVAISNYGTLSVAPGSTVSQSLASTAGKALTFNDYNTLAVNNGMASPSAAILPRLARPRRPTSFAAAPMPSWPSCRPAAWPTSAAAVKKSPLPAAASTCRW